MTYQLQKANKHTAVIGFYKKEWEDSLKEMLTDL